jgi:uncharacterized protein with HEPN domain
MAKRSARERLRDIEDAIEKIGRFLTNKSFENFKADALVHDAVVRNLEIVSEASRHIPTDLKMKASHIAWREIADFGNALRHGYEGVNDPILWNTIERDLPTLLTVIRSFLADPTIT